MMSDEQRELRQKSESSIPENLTAPEHKTGNPVTAMGSYATRNAELGTMNVKRRTKNGQRETDSQAAPIESAQRRWLS